MRRLLLPIVVLAFLGGLPLAPVQAQSPSEDDALAAPSAMSDGLEALARKVREAVVQVKVRTYDGLQSSGGGRSQLTETRSTGSGFFIDSSGYAVTNAHVVSGAHQVQVQRPSPPPPPPGEESVLRPRGDLLDAKVVGLDRETDVAVLEVEGSGYPTLPFGNSEALRRGELVFAFGNPMGLENSVSMGVVSARARQLNPGDPMIYIQTDAAINPGSSGGPLVNVQGEVVGLNTFIVSESGDNAGLGFAGPSNIVETVASQLREHGRVRRGVIGVNAQTVTDRLADALDVNASYRVVLSDVLPGSPAERAGLRAGDFVTHLNGEPMQNGRQLEVNLYGALGSLVQLRVVRGDSTFSTGVRVVERGGGDARLADLADPEDHLIDPLGILGLPLTDVVRNRIPGARFSSGTLVAASTRPPTPWGDRLQPGDLIYSVDGTRIKDPDHLRSRLESVPENDSILAHVLRDGRMRYLVLTVR